VISKLSITFFQLKYRNISPSSRREASGFAGKPHISCGDAGAAGNQRIKANAHHIVLGHLVGHIEGGGPQIHAQSSQISGNEIGKKSLPDGRLTHLKREVSPRIRSLKQHSPFSGIIGRLGDSSFPVQNSAALVHIHMSKHISRPQDGKQFIHFTRRVSAMDHNGYAQLSCQLQGSP